MIKNNMTHSQSQLIDFIPSPGFILVEDIKEREAITKSTPLNNDEPQARKAKVIRVGDEYITDFTALKKPPCNEGDIVIYRHVFGCDELEYNYVKYPIVHFDLIRGVIKQ